MKGVVLTLVLAMLPAIALSAGDQHGSHAMPTGHMAGTHAGHAASAVGRPGEADKVTRTVEVVMSDDMRFAPDKFVVKAGETIRFFIKNNGKVEHEMVIGSMAELKAHADMMRNMPGMKHAEPNMITLGPGQRGGLIWEFDTAGTVDFACLVPAHLEAGMAGQIEVE